ncbi:NAD(P)/FAD-dependent oxidoreductase [Streptomyces sp. NPDC093546]|uniref:NAD(P)/FAD-dependent oxidoreductase n=1 Tax=Streptomyces sp. NPDC093546 TaxID=3366040 RepID=UPI003826FCEF
MHSADVVVVGNGALGLSVAVEVARQAPETRVTVVGPPQRPMAATPAAGAMLNCFGEVTRYTARHPAARARFALARRALDAWPDWMDMLVDTAGSAGKALRDSHVEGTFVLYGGRSGLVAGDNFQAMQNAAAAHGEPHELVDPATVEGLSPRCDARPMQVLHLEREGCVDARAALAALEEAARQLGVRLVPGTVRELVTGASSVTGARLEDGSVLPAGTVVLAAGAASSRLADTALPPGAVPPLLHGTGVSLLITRTTTSPPGTRQVLRTPNRAATCGMHLVPLPQAGQYYIGATNLITTGPITGPELGSTHSLMRGVCEQFDQDLAFGRIQRLMAGSRPIPLDCFPLIGPCSVPGLVFATGTYRDGFHCSPVIARHIAATLTGASDPDPDLAPFAPERRPIQVLTPAEAVSDTIEHTVDTLGEQGMHLPFWLDCTPMEQWVRRRVEELYEQLGDGAVLAPELVYPQFLAPKSTDDTRALASVAEYLRAAQAYHGTASALPV